MNHIQGESLLRNLKGIRAKREAGSDKLVTTNMKDPIVAR